MNPIIPDSDAEDDDPATEDDLMTEDHLIHGAGEDDDDDLEDEEDDDGDEDDDDDKDEFLDELTVEEVVLAAMGSLELAQQFHWRAQYDDEDSENIANPVSLTPRKDGGTWRMRRLRNGQWEPVTWTSLWLFETRYQLQNPDAPHHRESDLELGTATSWDIVRNMAMQSMLGDVLGNYPEQHFQDDWEGDEESS